MKSGIFIQNLSSMSKRISGFSRFSKEEKVAWIVQQHFHNNTQSKIFVEQYWNTDEKLQQLHDDFIENTISNFYLPLGVAPNFNINGEIYTLPMAVEESSVVAAAAKAAKYWDQRGGFHTEVIDVEKVGQVHFLFSGHSDALNQFIQDIEPTL